MKLSESPQKGFGWLFQSAPNSHLILKQNNLSSSELKLFPATLLPY